MKGMGFNLTGSLWLAIASSNAVAANYVSPENLWTYNEDIFVPTQVDPEDPSNLEQMGLPANVFVPVATTAGEKYPAVIFINSWSLNEQEYGSIAKELANRGYVVLRYTTRGFWSSPGEIDTSGNNDIADAQNAITYLIENYPVDAQKIALGGTSYGSGISMTTAMRDERVAAVVATSTWGSLKESLWPNETPKDDWIKVLIGASSNPIGDRNPEIDANLENMYEHKNVQATIDWAMERSAVNFIDQANARERKPALYITNNLHDYLFQPNTVINFLQKYEGPWHVDFNFGIHASGEAAGLLGNDDTSYVWQNAYAWLDHHLKGEENYIDQIDKVSVRVKSSVAYERDSFPDFPVHDRTVKFFANPQPGAQGGELGTSATVNADQPVVDSDYEVVWTGGATGAAQMSGHYYMADAIDPRGALVFKTPVLTEPLRLRGASRLKFTAHVQHNIQYFGYLMDYDPATGKAHWIGHGPFTWHKPEGSGIEPTEPVEVNIEMFWTAHDVAAGHQLFLVVDGADSEYYKYPDSANLHQLVIDSEHPMTVEIPVIDQAPGLDSIEARQSAAERAQAEAEAAQDPSRGAGGSNESYGAGGGGSWHWLVAGLMSCLMLRRKFQR